MCRQLLGLLAALVAAEVTAAEPLTVEFSGSARCGTIALTAVSGATRHTYTAHLGSATTLYGADTPADWILYAKAANCWTAPLRITQDTPVRHVTMRFVPSGIVKMHSQATGEGRVQVAASFNAEELLDALEYDCERKRVVECAVPAGVVHLRVIRPSRVPLYFWDVAIPAGGTADIGELSEAGLNSVIGWVHSETENAADGVVVSAAGTSDRANTNKYGFFQLFDVSAGSMNIVANWKGATATAHVDVSPAGESRVAPILRLQKLPGLEVFINPPVEPFGLPWTVTLSRRTSDSQITNVISRGSASEGGVWTASGVEPANYVLIVTDREGNRYYREELTVGVNPSPIFVALQYVAFHGRLSVGGSPMAGEIEWFHPGGKRFSTKTDDEGRFSGSTPSEGEWNASVLLRPSGTVHVIDGLEIRKRPDGASTRVDIDLPAGRIAGVVVDESGEKAPSRLILVRNETPVARLDTDSGDFELVGVETGEAMLSAYGRNGTSGLQPVRVEDADQPPVRVTLGEKKRVGGRVTDPLGRPVSGAIVRMWSPFVAMRIEDATDGAGRFDLAVPRNLDSFNVVVISSDLPTKCVSVPQPSSNLEVRLGYAAGTVLLKDGRVPPWPVLGRINEPLIPLSVYTVALGNGPLREATEDGLAFPVEPGDYRICSSLAAESCLSIRVMSNDTTVVDLRDLNGGQP